MHILTYEPFDCHVLVPQHCMVHHFEGPLVQQVFKQEPLETHL